METGNNYIILSYQSSTIHSKKTKKTLHVKCEIESFYPSVLQQCVPPCIGHRSVAQTKACLDPSRKAASSFSFLGLYQYSSCKPASSNAPLCSSPTINPPFLIYTSGPSSKAPGDRKKKETTCVVQHTTSTTPPYRTHTQKKKGTRAYFNVITTFQLY